MADATTFLTVMAALSTATQTFVDHVIKRRVDWLDKPKDDSASERRRQSAVHVISFVVGGGLSASINIDTLSYLGATGGPVSNAIAAGMLVSFGGSFFNEALGAIREFKEAQKSIRKAQTP